MTNRDEIERLLNEYMVQLLRRKFGTKDHREALMSAVDRVLAERDRANQRYLANKAILNEELAERDARIAALEKALREYGQHKSHCDKSRHPEYYKCECGLSAALAAQGKEP